MYKEFLEFVNFNAGEIKSDKEFLEKTAGQSFLNGLYTIFTEEDMAHWNLNIADFYPEFDNKVFVFGYDWNGNIMAYDREYKAVLKIDPEIQKVSYAGKKDVSLSEFHKEIALKPDETIGLNVFNEWRKLNNNISVPYGSCVGYKVPFCMDGKDEYDNLQLTDLENYWRVTIDIYNSLEN